jgi:hypothetical protein
MAVWIDHTGHQHEPFRIDLARATRQSAIRSDRYDRSIIHGYAAVEFTIVTNNARIANNKINLH